MLLCVYPNGYGSGKETHVSVFIKLTKGRYDGNLPFPILDMIFTVQLLNWKDDSGHIEEVIVFDKDTPVECRQQCVTIDGVAAATHEAAWQQQRTWVGHERFLSHDQLCNDSPYINEDMISFRVLDRNSPNLLQTGECF